MRALQTGLLRPGPLAAGEIGLFVVGNEPVLAAVSASMPTTPHPDPPRPMTPAVRPSLRRRHFRSRDAGETRGRRRAAPLSVNRGDVGGTTCSIPPRLLLIVQDCI